MRPIEVGRFGSSEKSAIKKQGRMTLPLSLTIDDDYFFLNLPLDPARPTIPDPRRGMVMGV